MSDSAAVEEMIDKLIRKAMFEILTAKETHLDGHLPRAVSQRFRKTVMDTLNEMGEVIKFIAVAEHDGAMVNELAFDLIKEVHRAVVGGDADALEVSP